MDNGYIKLHRKITKWGWYSDPNTKSLFLHLLLVANFTAGEFLGYTIQRGQAVVGRKALSHILGISQRSIRTSITRLKSTNEIATQTTNKFTIITIVKYEQYQEKPKRTTSRTTSRTTNNRPTTDHNIRRIRRIRKTTLATEAVAEVFDSSVYLQEVIANKQPHVSLVGKYLLGRGVVFPTKLAAQVEVRRWLKDARTLAEYSQAEIDDTCDWVSKEWPDKWNLSTVAKQINNKPNGR